MNKYRLDGIINGRNCGCRDFKTREAAELYMGNLILAHNLEVQDIIKKNRGHDQEFYCNDHSRFFINRIPA